ncbi:MAG: hypothetical protein V4568_14580 [Pseudomonadota bacterium]
MITVAILINGQPIVARNAVNLGERDEQGRTAYKTDSGEIVYHARDAGAVALAKKLLDMIRNDEEETNSPRKGETA